MNESIRRSVSRLRGSLAAMPESRIVMALTMLGMTLYLAESGFCFLQAFDGPDTVGWVWFACSALLVAAAILLCAKSLWSIAVSGGGRGAGAAAFAAGAVLAAVLVELGVVNFAQLKLLMMV